MRFLRDMFDADHQIKMTGLLFFLLLLILGIVSYLTGFRAGVSENQEIKQFASGGSEYGITPATGNLRGEVQKVDADEGFVEVLAEATDRTERIYVNSQTTMMEQFVGNAIPTPLPPNPDGTMPEQPTPIPPRQLTLEDLQEGQQISVTFQVRNNGFVAMNLMVEQDQMPQQQGGNNQNDQNNQGGQPQAADQDAGNPADQPADAPVVEEGADQPADEPGA